jgi:hypothetical protein
VPIRQSSQGANDNSNDIINRVQIRYFRSLLSIPFYLLEKGVNGTPASDLPKETAVDHLPTKAWTGYYLNKSSSSFIFIQWRRQADATLSSKIESQSSDMVLSLKRYWNFKWNESYIEFLESDLWLGEWNYECRDEVVSTEGSVYMGSCQVSEKSGRLNAVTKRNQTCIGAGQCTPIFINWTNEEDDGDIIHKYRNGKDNILFLSLSYRPEQPGTASRSGGNNLKPTDQKKDNSRIKAFVKLKAVKGNGSEEDNIIDENTIRDGNYHLKGEYYIIFPDDSMRRNDIFPSTYGEIILRRPNHQSISKARQSGKPKTSSR